MLVKGCFEKLLPKSGASYVLPTLGQYTTWAELPHITYEDLSCVQVPPPKKITADELALGNDLVVRMQDLYSGAADPETMGEIIKSQDNLKSIVLAEITRGKGKELHAWLQAQQKPLPELTRDRPDISGKAQQAVTLLLHSLKNGEPEEKLEKLRDDLRQAHTENWSQFRDILEGHDKSETFIVKSNTIFNEARCHSARLQKQTLYLFLSAVILVRYTLFGIIRALSPKPLLAHYLYSLWKITKLPGLKSSTLLSKGDSK
jgi:hypothetical protein